jgi:hypothetical protein
MYVPNLMERVSLVGTDEVYLVTRVDYKAQVADLLLMLYGQLTIPAVPFVVPFDVIEEILLSEPPNRWPN